MKQVGLAALGAALSTLTLTACASQPEPSQVGLLAMPAMRENGKLRRETFTAAKATHGCTKAGRKGVFLSFGADGKATGPFPGTFSLKGEATITPGSAYVSETYQIKSGGTTVSGSASSTDGALMKITCNYRTHESSSFTFTSIPYDVENTRGLTTITWANGAFKQSFR